MIEIDELAEDLEDFLGSDSVFSTQEELVPYSTDPYTKTEKKPLLAVRIHQPQQLNRIAFLLRRFNQEKQCKVSITPRGCGLSVSQGMLSSNSIIVDLSELKEAVISEDGETIDIQCGATFEQISRILNENDLCLGMESTTSPRCTIGGFIASGGLGFSSIRYGSISTHIRNLRVFLSIGSMIETGMEKVFSQGTGYDLTRVFVGSEGTLGIIVSAVLDIFPNPICASNSIAKVNNLKMLQNLATKTLTMGSIGSVLLLGGELWNMEEIGVDGAYSILVRLEGDEDVVDSSLDDLRKICGRIEDGDDLWKRRFIHSEISDLKTPLSIDEFLIPTTKLKVILQGLEDIAAKVGIEFAFHAAPASPNAWLTSLIMISDDLPSIESGRGHLLDELGNLKVVPYCVGTRKIEYFNTVFPQASELVKKIKSVFDPSGIMNEGVLLSR